jgi:hypothetical protein
VGKKLLADRTTAVTLTLRPTTDARAMREAFAACNVKASNRQEAAE